MKVNFFFQELPLHVHTKQRLKRVKGLLLVNFYLHYYDVIFFQFNELYFHNIHNQIGVKTRNFLDYIPVYSLFYILDDIPCKRGNQHFTLL